MRIKVVFKKETNTLVPIRNQKEVNSFVHKMLGKNNKWHDSFSNYSISSLQGGKLNDDKKTLQFNGNPYIMISSQDNEFIGQLYSESVSSDHKLFGMSIDGLIPMDFVVNKYYDRIITISPILLKDKDSGKKITVKDSGFYEKLYKNCIAKLGYMNIVDPTFKIEPYNPEKAKTKMIYVGDVFNPCSMVSLKVFGKKKTREALYNLGLGNSCGCGFGSINIF